MKKKISSVILAAFLSLTMLTGCAGSSGGTKETSETVNGSVIGGYGGTGDKHADVYRVHVQGEVNFTGNKTGIGGMFGQLANADVKACSADVKVSSGKNYVGGLCGYIGASTVSISSPKCP